MQTMPTTTMVATAIGGAQINLHLPEPTSCGGGVCVCDGGG